MIKKYSIVVLLMVAGCAPKDNYDINTYYGIKQQDKILTGIVTYLLDAPPQKKMEDRFKPEHANYYSFRSSQFSFDKYFVAPDSTHYFYVIRPSGNSNEKRGVGGHYRMDNDYHISDFREIFVTPSLPITEVKGRCAFLFDEMVKGDIKKYLLMPSYVQWPGEASYYDTITYEWKLKPEFQTN